MSIDDFFDISLPGPLSIEQQRIAEILSTWDKAIEIQEKLIVKLNQCKDVVFANAISKVGYQAVALITLGKCLRGVNFNPKKDLFEKMESGSAVLLRATNFTTDIINMDEVIYINDKCVNAEQYIKKYDILLSMSSGSKKAIGKACLVKEEIEKACVGSFCAIFRTNRPVYIHNFFLTDFYRKQLARLLEGSSINNLNSSLVESLQVIVPKENELLDKLESLLECFDKEISLSKQKLAALKLQKQALMQLLLTGIVRVKV